MTYDRMGDAEAREARQEAEELEQERQMLASAAEHAKAINAAPLFRIVLTSTGPLAYDVTDGQDEDQVKVATITYSEGGECWNVALELGGWRDAANPDDTPGNRNFRDFEAAAAYAESWCRDVDGDL